MMGDDNVDVSGAELPRPSSLRRVGQCIDQRLDPGVLVHGANQNSNPSTAPLREGVISPWVSLLELVSL
jgi:hypothetical protein